MSTPSARVTAAEISRLAGVTRATVSNWRRRHVDFPAPSGGSEASPAYDLEAVRAWLAARGQLPASSPRDELRIALRAHPGTVATELLPLVLAANRLGEGELASLTELPGPRLARRAQELIHLDADAVPGAQAVRYRSDEAPLILALLRCLQREGVLIAAESLAARAAEDGVASGTYQTPAPLVTLMADLLTAPGGGYPASVYDPACGTGNLLVAAAERGAGTLYGQDIALVRAAQTAVRLAVLAPTTTYRVRAGDSLIADAFADLPADAALCNPPFGNRDWGHDELAYDPRWIYGLPPKIESELAWVQHCLAHLSPGAPAVMLMPPAVADRAAGRRIRAELVRRGALRAVMALPAGAAAPLHIGLHLWLLVRPDGQEGRPSPILFVDTADLDPGQPVEEQAPTRRPPVDWQALHSAIVDAWRAFVDYPEGFETVPGVARAVGVIDLLDESVDLSPARHVRPAPVASAPDLHAETARALRGRLRRASAGIVALSGGETWAAVGAEPRSWRSAAIADLLRGGALTLLRTSGPGRGTTADRPAAEQHTGGKIESRPGDVLLPEILRNGALVPRVVDEGGAGQPLARNVYLLRPDPQRLDPWFLAGFLAAEENVHDAAVGTSVVRLDVRRLRVPLLPLDEQRRYGKAFRRLHALRHAADLVSRLADETARVLGSGLTVGALLPPDTDQNQTP